MGIIPNGVINLVVPYSVADKAGLKKGLKISRINDIDVTYFKNRDIWKLIKEKENYLVLDVFKIFNFNEFAQVSQILNESKDVDEELSNMDVQSVRSLPHSKYNGSYNFIYILKITILIKIDHWP